MLSVRVEEAAQANSATSSERSIGRGLRKVVPRLRESQTRVPKTGAKDLRARVRLALPLRELLTPPRLAKPNLLALDFARIARD